MLTQVLIHVSAGVSISIRRSRRRRWGPESAEVWFENARTAGAQVGARHCRSKEVKTP